MEPHPDFADVELPRSVTLTTCQMTPLSPEHTEEDYAIVMETAALLSGPGEWPDGLTLEDNAIDLAWHEREFTEKRSFSWILRDSAETYLGCFYIYPAIGGRGTAKVVLWIRNRPDRETLCRQLKSELEAWCTDNVPAGIATRWTCKPDV